MYLVRHRGHLSRSTLPQWPIYRKVHGTRDRKEAEAWLLREEKLLQDDTLRLASPPTARRVSDLEAEVMAHYAASPTNTREGIRYALLHFKRICGDIHLQDINFATIEKFKRIRWQREEARIP